MKWPKEWKEAPFERCMEPVSIERSKQIPANAYQVKGAYPIVDQGQGLIAGWTDDERAVFRGDLPVIVFGDHTRVFKYVDFPFAVGADGTKIFRPADMSLLDSRFFYFSLLSLTIPSRGYSRHFKLLREQRINIPPLPEQRAIAAVLFKIQKAIETQEKIIQSLRDLKKSTMQRLFTRGLHGEKTKMTEIGEIPESWSHETMADCADISTGGTPDRANEAFWKGGIIPWVKTGEVHYDVIQDTEEKITKAGLENSAARLCPKGTLLVAMYGQGVTRGKVAVLGIQAAANQACAAIIPRQGVSVWYLCHYMEFAYERLRNFAHGANQQNLNTQLIKDFRFPKPAPDEQEEIIHVLRAIDQKMGLVLNRHVGLQDLFKTTLNKLMSGELRV